MICYSFCLEDVLGTCVQNLGYYTMSYGTSNVGADVLSNLNRKSFPQGEGQHHSPPLTKEA